MSTDRDVTPIVRSWLHEDAYEDADRILNLVLDEIDTTPQRRVIWRFARIPFVNNSIRLALAATVVVALIFGIRFLSGPPVGNDSEPTPTPSVAASAVVSPISRPGATWLLDPGTYSLPDFPLGITFTVPTGWHSCSDSLVEQSVCYPSAASQFDSRVSFLIVENVVADPCSLGEEPLDPPAGPSVDDLVAAISALDGFEASAPVDLTVDGYLGKRFTLTTPMDPGCELMKTWATADRTNNVSPGEVNLLEVLDVNGTRLVIAGTYYPEQPGAAEERAALEQIVASVLVSE